LGSAKWLKTSVELEATVNLTLSLIHPELYKCGLLMLQKLRQEDATAEIASKWQSVHTRISIVSNQIMPFHRDSKGRPEWYDTLLSYSDTRARPRLSIEDIGLDLDYQCGTVVSFCGSIFKHGVRTWGPGDRVCYAHFMRESVRERLKVPAAGWVNQSLYGDD
jgi:hypothetical protein